MKNLNSNLVNIRDLYCHNKYAFAQSGYDPFGKFFRHVIKMKVLVIWYFYYPFLIYKSFPICHVFYVIYSVSVFIYPIYSHW